MPSKPKKPAAKSAPRRKVGRPSIYSEKLAMEICLRIACGDSVRTICKDAGMPSQDTIYRWVFQNAEFSEKYARARAMQMESWADEILGIADDGSNDTYEDEDGNPRTDHDVIARSRLRVDTRKWLMSKLAPKKYGDKVDVNHGGQADNPLTLLLKQVSGTAFVPQGEGAPEED
ncbi:terminase small subunit [Ralstonia phage p2110]|nr:terminase small subunit [Ralstonia phage p2110]